jgi:uncharacterized protein (TIGR02996 family)
MSSGDAFLHAILAAPDDDAPRFIYADWLDEHGEPGRAELIRVQCELARLDASDPRRWELEDRESALLAARGAEWAGPVRELVGGWRFRRGFVEEISLPAAGFLRHGETLFRLAPLRRARLRDVRELPALLGDLGRLQAFVALLSRLEGIDLSGEPLLMIPNVGLELLAVPPLRLTSLNLECTGVGGGAVETLANSPLAETLTDLNLGRNPLGADGVHALAASRHLKRLTSLSLSAVGRANESIVPALVGSPLLPRLTALRLGHCRLGPDVVQRLAASPAAAGLEELDLCFNPLGAEGVRALAASPHLTRLTALNLSRTHRGDDGAKVLAESALLGRLTALDLSLNRVGDAGGRALAAYARPARMTRLDLIYNRLTPAAMRALCDRYGERACLFRR